MNTVLFCACGEDDAFEFLGGAGDIEGVEEILQHCAVDVPVLLLRVLLEVGGEEEIFGFDALELLGHFLGGSCEVCVVMFDIGWLVFFLAS